MWLGDQDLRETEGRPRSEEDQLLVRRIPSTHRLHRVQGRARLLQEKKAYAGHDITDSKLAETTQE